MLWPYAEWIQEIFGASDSKMIEEDIDCRFVCLCGCMNPRANFCQQTSFKWECDLGGIYTRKYIPIPISGTLRSHFLLVDWWGLAELWLHPLSKFSIYKFCVETTWSTCGSVCNFLISLLLSPRWPSKNKLNSRMRGISTWNIICSAFDGLSV